MHIWIEIQIQFQTRFNCYSSFEYILASTIKYADVRIEVIEKMRIHQNFVSHVTATWTSIQGFTSSILRAFKLRAEYAGQICLIQIGWPENWKRANIFTRFDSFNGAIGQLESCWPSEKIDANCVRPCITRMPNYSIVCLHNIRISYIMVSCTRLKVLRWV